MNTKPVLVGEEALQRIRGEFLEMPGLRLTMKQAQRLWGLDEDTCGRLLECLVETRFLARIGHDTYARPTGGAVALPALRVAAASVARPPLNTLNGTRAS